MRHLRPTMESLEGRSLLSASAVKVTPNVPAQELINLQAPPLVSQQASTATLLISRSNPSGTGLSDTLALQVATGPTEQATLANGRSIPSDYPLATAGVQYQSINQTVTFPPGVMTQAITIPIVPGAANPSRLSFGVTATPINSSGLQPSLAVKTTVVLAADINASLPQIVGSHLVKQGKKVVGIAVRFNQPMDPASVQNINAYAIADLTSHARQLPGLFGLLFSSINNTANKRVPIKSAVYNLSQNQVILYTKQNLVAKDNYEIQNTNTQLTPIRNSLGVILNDNGSGNQTGKFRFNVTHSGSSI